MCGKCVRTPYPDRGAIFLVSFDCSSPLTIILAGRMCLESGTYLVNLTSCSQCNRNTLMTRTVDNTDTASQDSWDEEEEVEVVEDIQYSHVCGACDHNIALHKVRRCW